MTDRKLTDAQAGVLCARHEITCYPTRLAAASKWYAWCSNLKPGLGRFAPTYAEAMAAVCEAAGLDMTVESTVPVWFSDLQRLGYVMGLNPGDETLPGMRAAWDAKCEENHNLNTANYGLCDENERLATANEKFHGNLSDLNIGVQRKHEQVESLQAENANLRADNTRLRDRNDGLRANNERQATLIDSYTAEIGELSSEIENLRGAKQGEKIALDLVSRHWTTIEELRAENEVLRAEKQRFGALQDNGLHVIARGCPACEQLTLGLAAGQTCLPCQVQALREENKRLRAADHADPRASEIIAWLDSQPGRPVMRLHPGEPVAIRAECTDWSKSTQRPTARAAMDAYEAQQKPKAEPQAVAMLLWWRTRPQLPLCVGALVSGIMDNWLRSPEAQLATAELDREGTDAVTRSS